MNSQIYLGLLGPEKLVKDFAKKASLSGAVICELGSKIKESNTPKQWLWRTARRSTYTSYPEDSILPILREHEILLRDFNRLRHASHACVTLICQFEEGESPRGIFLSRETIEVLANFGAELNVDTVSIMSPPEG